MGVGNSLMPSPFDLFTQETQENVAPASAEEVGPTPNPAFVAPSSSSTEQSRRWFITLNNYTADELEQLKRVEAKYILLAKEVGQGGTPHIQGVISFCTNKRRSALQRINPRIHWERVIDFEAAVNYCLKEDTSPFIKDKREQGSRNDMKDACAIVVAKGYKAVARDFPSQFVRYHGGFRALRAATLEPRDPAVAPVVRWIYGDTGTGKSRYVHTYCAEAGKTLFVAHDTAKWWDGYEQQDVVLIDDMRASFCRFSDFLRLIDRYPRDVEVKGGFVPLNSDFFITSQYPPTAVYNSESRSGEDIRQLLRRITRITKKSWPPNHTALPGTGSTDLGEVITEDVDPAVLLQQVSFQSVPTGGAFVTGFIPPTFQ